MTEDEALDLEQESPQVSEEEEKPEVSEETPEEKSESEKEVETLKAELTKADETNSELKDRMLRIQADFENYKKRAQRQKDDLAEYTKSEFVKKLLPVLDNFDLALSHSSTDNPEAYKKGIELVSKQLKDVLDSEGLKEIEAQGKVFNPNYHHGVAVDQNPEADDQEITEVFQKGYEFNGKVIRPSMVKVNQK